MSVRITRNAMVTPSTTEMAAVEKAKTSELKTSVGMSAGMRMVRARIQLARVTWPAATGEADQKLPKMRASTGTRMTKPMITIRMVYTALMAFSVCIVSFPRPSLRGRPERSCPERDPGAWTCHGGSVSKPPGYRRYAVRKRKSWPEM